MLLLLLLSTGGVRAVSRQRFAAARRARQGRLRRGEGSRRAGTLSEHAGQIAAATGEDPARVRQGPERCRSSAGATGQGPGRVSQSKKIKKKSWPLIPFLRQSFISFSFFIYLFLSFLAPCYRLLADSTGSHHSILLFFIFLFISSFLLWFYIRSAI